MERDKTIRQFFIMLLVLVYCDGAYDEKCNCNPIIQIGIQSEGKQERFVSVTTQLQFDQMKQIFENVSNTLLDNQEDRFRNFLNLLDLDTHPIDCQDIRSMGHIKSGVHKIYPVGTNGMNVYCDQSTDGGGWTVFQRRVNGSVDFHRNWFDYQIGFGDLEGEFWLGNQQIHVISSQGWYEIRIDLVYPDNQKWYAKYNVFRLADTNDKYRLLLDGYSGTAGNSMKHNYGRRFSATDQDNDDHGGNCVEEHSGGWWFGQCDEANLNGRYRSVSYETGINWDDVSSSQIPVYTDMKIRRWEK